MTERHKRVKIYPAHLNVQVAQEMDDAIRGEMEIRRGNGLPASMADVIRDWLETGAVEAGAMTIEEE